MNEIQHKYFGTLNIETDNDVSVIWEKEINEIPVWLWYGNNGEIPEALLDSYAHFLDHLDEKIKEGRRAIIEYFNNDRYYIDFHIKELDLDSLPSNAIDFANRMSITNIGLWTDSNTPHITMDFMIDPEVSDEILCANFGEDGSIDIAWES